MEQESAQDILTRLADTFANVLSPEHIEDRIEVTALKSSDHAAVFEIGLDEHRAIVKIFADRANFEREHQALVGFQGDLVPQILFVSIPDQLVMTRLIDGEAFGETLSADNLMQRTEFLGQWFGRLANLAPKQPSSENWADYLGHYQTGFSKDMLAQQAELLKATQVVRLSLCHNDNALGNFILDKSKRLVGIDFEAAQMKPEGWDLVMAAKVLFARAPDQLSQISNSLLRGYQLTGETNILPGNFDQIINVLVLANISENSKNSPQN